MNPVMNRSVCLVVCALAATACTSDSTGPGASPGHATLVLEAPPGTNIGALRLEITGGDVSGVVAAGEVLAFGAKADGTYAIALFGELDGGPVAQVTVPDLRMLHKYTVSVSAAADRKNEEIAGSGLQVRVRSP